MLKYAREIVSGWRVIHPERVSPISNREIAGSLLVRRGFLNTYQPPNEFTITCESPMIGSFARIPAGQLRLRMVLSGSWKNE
jgi:hypothetical protein